MTRDDLIAKFENDVRKRSRSMRTLLALDQLANVIIWNGSQDETVSSHIGRRIEAGKSFWMERKLCCFLQWLETSHCKKAKGE